jgi:uncharacterized ion transporter superfamily protein YfcC
VVYLEQGTLKIGKKAFLTSIIILLVLMLTAYFVSVSLPAGSFQRTMENGREIVVPGTFTYIDKAPLPMWRVLTAPLEVLWGPDSLMVIVISLFILLIGGSFAVLDRAGVLTALVGMVVRKFGHNKTLLLLTVTLVFMLFGSLLGILEEIIPLVPLVVALALSLGWDSLTGLGMSLLAAGFGFSSAIANPFTIGVAQRLAGLPVFSGALFRVLVFVLSYLLLAAFLLWHTRRIEADPQKSPVWQEDLARGKDKEKAFAQATAPFRSILWFALTLVAIGAVVAGASLVPGLADLSLPLVGLLFVLGGVGAGLLAGLGVKTWRAFAAGVAGIAPGILLILMAMSVKLIIHQAGVLDTLLYQASLAIAGAKPQTAAVLTYGLVLIMNFFIGSASAKAFLVIPLIAPLADLVGISRQVAVLAFAFGDGFSNILYPTNPILLIALGLTVVSYPRWFRFVIGLQLAMVILCILLLLLAVAVGLGPF